MAPARGAGYSPLDIESSIPGQWRTIEEHERLQQQGVLSSTPSDTSLQGIPPDFYKQQRDEQAKKTHKRAVWAVVGCILLGVVIIAAVLSSPRHPQLRQPTADGGQQHPDTSAAPAMPHGVNERGSRGSGGSAQQHSNTTHGLWNEGGSTSSTAQQGQDAEGFTPCHGPELKCFVVNKQPIPQADFRNLPRHTSAAGGMVAADNSRCSQIGRDVLVAGGNAVDAAVAAVLCLGVVNPVSSGLGGGAFITVRLANGTAAFFDARESAPAAATEDMYTGLPSNASLFGGLAVAVPGELQGLEAVWKRFGTKPWAELVQPAADLARSGFAAHPYLVYILSGTSNMHRLEAVPALRNAFLVPVPGKGWRAPRVGELCCKRPQLAATLEKIATQGASFLTGPEVTSALARELSAAGGIITADDLATAAPVERELLRVELGDLQLLVPPPPSSAAVVAFALKFLAAYGNTLQSSPHTGTPGGSAASTEAAAPGAAAPAEAAVLASFGAEPGRDKALGMHRLVEALKHGFAVRTALGDPGSGQQRYKGASRITAAVRDLLSDSFVEELRSMTRDDTVLDGTQYGGKWNPKGVAPADEQGTSHLCVVDADRNAVSLTTSINTPFGAHVVSDSTGILFGNTMDDFASPSKRTVVTPQPNKANFIAPGRRPLSAMSPIIVTHKPSGRLVAVAGASGGPLIVSATTQSLARLLLEGADVHHAVAAPRLHDQLLPDNSSFYEAYSWGYTQHQMSQAVVAQLNARNQVTTASDHSIGVSQVIYVDYAVIGAGVSAGAPAGGSGSSRGVLHGASDSRKDGAPAGHD